MIIENNYNKSEKKQIIHYCHTHCIGLLLKYIQDHLKWKGDVGDDDDETHEGKK